MPTPWRPVDAKRCPHCNIYRGPKQFTEAVEGDESTTWCLACQREHAIVIRAAREPGATSHEVRDDSS